MSTTSPTTSDLVSVVVSTMERPDALRRCLRSIGEGRVRPLEIVVVDQSRDERTMAVVGEAVEGGLPVRAERQPPRGLGASQNLAVRLARGGVVAVTDDDCVVDGRWLEVVERSFATAPALGVLGGRVLALPAEGDRTWPVSTRTSTRRLELPGRGAPWDVGSGNNFAVRRELFLAIGGCDERLGPGSPGLGGVDMDLFYRLLRAGAHARYEPDAVVYHERQTVEQRLGRRPLYGHGMGAAVALRMRDGDRGAAALLASWLGLRVSMMGGALLRGDWAAAREEVTMLASTARGMRHGMRQGARAASDG